MQRGESAALFLSLLRMLLLIQNLRSTPTVIDCGPLLTLNRYCLPSTMNFSPSKSLMVAFEAMGCSSFEEVVGAVTSSTSPVMVEVDPEVDVSSMSGMTGAPVVVVVEVFSIVILNKSIKMLSGNDFGNTTTSTITTWCNKAPGNVVPAMVVSRGVCSRLQ